jgi:hypothetical protein
MTHSDEKSIKKFNYFEYCEIWFGGNTVATGARRIKTDVTEIEVDYKRERRFRRNNVKIYEVEAVKYKDHVRIGIESVDRKVDVVVALPDNSRYAFMGLTGENCRIFDVNITKEETHIKEDYIPRIAREVSYIDRLVGNVPNVQIDGYRSASTLGIPVSNQMEIKFHAMSLPTAWLIWHCAYIVLYYSDDGTVEGDNYKEYALVRLDGEYWDTDKIAKNEIVVEKQENFVGWDAWKEENKKGIDVCININRRGNRIVMTTENMGLYLKNTTNILDKNDQIYVALSGDQCALTDIRIKK